MVRPVPAAIETTGLTKRFGATTAVDGLDLAIPQGEVFGFLGPNGAGQDDDDPHAARPDPPDRGIGADRRPRRLERPGGDPPPARRRARRTRRCGRSSPRARRFDLLGNLHGSFDVAYRDELIERFDLDPDKRMRAFSTGNRQKVALIAAFMTRADVLDLRRADQRPRSAAQGRLPRMPGRGQGARPDRLPLLAPPDRGRGERRPRRRCCAAGGSSRSGTLRGAAPPAARCASRRRSTARRRTSAGSPGVDAVQATRHVRPARSTARSRRCSTCSPPARPIRLTSREPSLEDLFLARYGDGD